MRLAPILLATLALAGGDGTGRQAMSLTFPDGTTAQLVHPAALTELDLMPYSSWYLQAGGHHVEGDFFVIEDDVRAALAEYDDEYPREFGFQFGRWAVVVHDVPPVEGGMTERERLLWRSSFRGRESDDGFLVLSAHGPLRLARAGEHAGPEIGFSDERRRLELFPGRCQGLRFSRSPGFANWCLSDLMRAHAAGPESFLDELLAGLEVRDVRLVASRTT